MSDEATKQQLVKAWENSAFPELISICAEFPDDFLNQPPAED